MNRVLLADDHPMIRTALEVLLRNTDFEIVGVATTGEAALAQTAELAPDILLLDLQMPGGDGMSVLRRIQADGRNTRVILLTAAIDDASLLEARALEVCGIVLKNSDPAYLLDCLDHVRHGRTWLDPEIADRVQSFASDKGKGRHLQLTHRELQILGFVREGLRNREIAERIGVKEGTIKAYLHGVFEKLGVTSRTELAIRADEFL
ncbi:response regulator [Sphingomonas edaphi]|uniref:DNA-binding response regulator n=1 Tax=Sphingomonas edaphi TaxID=2315689 RepID=A0A418Q0Q4_9SPHN|nr:response regulator transcription factor [Sphingomonas edaphi]RIX31499.1 DNA-binding response regulator [Sphingomonas edaphi]